MSITWLTIFLAATAPQNTPGPAATDAPALAPEPAAAAAAAPAQASAPPAEAAPGRVLTLAEALSTAKANQPQIRQALAATEAAQGRSTQALAPMLPQVSGSASYQRSLHGPISAFGATSNNFYNFSGTASELIFDFGQSPNHFRSARASVEGAEADEKTTLLQVLLSVRTVFFSARADKDLVNVAKENLANQERHLDQIEGFVRVGTRSEIDLAQTRTDRANARVQLITAQNNYQSAKAQLNQAMGIEGPVDYDVSDETLGTVELEDADMDALLSEALSARPEFVSFARKARAQQLTVYSLEGGYAPSLSVSTNLYDRGADLHQNDMAWGWTAQAVLSWQLFAGGFTYGQVQEANANLRGLSAQLDQTRQQVRLDVEQARLAVRANKAAIGAAAEAVINARERLRLAEGRYQTGVGSVIELGDAQVAMTSALAQKVQADYNLATARAQLIKALGRE